MIRVAVIDDHPIARYGIDRAFEGASDLSIVASLSTVEQLRQARTQDELIVDVVLLDLYLDSGDPAIDAISELAAWTRVLVMSASAMPDDVIRAIQAGASGYLTKRSAADLLISGVRTVAVGGFLLSTELADIMQSAVALSAPAQAALSPREEEALRLLARGLTHSQIATRMGVQKPTVDTYVERIRAKLQVGNKAELTRAAIERQRGQNAAPHHTNT